MDEEKHDMAGQVAEIMRTMRTKTAFNVIGGITQTAPHVLLLMV